jgi:glycosyltransferase involved in cell wall biosynthesis
LSIALGVLLPVCNAQHSLAGGVADILELLAEWSGRFKLIVVDDGSTDETVEVSQELAARYPQIRLIRHPIRLGLAEAIQTGLDEADAQLILVGNDAYELDVDDLRTLWRLRDMQRALDAESSAAPPANSTASADSSRDALSLARLARHLGFQTIRRAAFDRLRLDQAIDAIARIDAAGRGAATATTPNFVDRVLRLARGK